MGRMFYYRLWAGRRKINKLSNELNKAKEEVRALHVQSPGGEAAGPRFTQTARHPI